MAKKNDALINEAKKIKAELDELKKKKKTLDSSKAKKTKVKPVFKRGRNSKEKNHNCSRRFCFGNGKIISILYNISEFETNLRR